MAYEDKWVADVISRTITLNNISSLSSASIIGEYVWTDGTNVYYSNNSTQYVLDKSTLTWQSNSWGGTNLVLGSDIWTDGTDIYVSNNSKQYVLDKSNMRWVSKTWYGLSSNISSGNQIWTDGTNVYYSRGTEQYVLDKSTSTWSQKTWNGLSSLYGSSVWTDGTNIYYSRGDNQYVLDKSTSTWSQKTWNGIIPSEGYCVWSDNTGIYYVYGTTIYELELETSTWNPAQTVLPSGIVRIYGYNTWSDGTYTYYGAGNAGTYKLSKSLETDIPRRLSFPESIESSNPAIWITENDKTRNPDFYKQTYSTSATFDRLVDDDKKWGNEYSIVSLLSQDIYYKIYPEHAQQEIAKGNYSYAWYYAIESSGDIRGETVDYPTDAVITLKWRNDGTKEVHVFTTSYSDFNQRYYCDPTRINDWRQSLRYYYHKYIIGEGQPTVLPYIALYPELLISENFPGSWVTDSVPEKYFKTKHWDGFNNITGFGIWKDGNTVYYMGTDFYNDTIIHRVYDQENNKWLPKEWTFNGNTPSNMWGNYVWTDGTDIYYSTGSYQFVLDRSTDTWNPVTWNNYQRIEGTYVWTDGTDIYYSIGTIQYVLDKSTRTWNTKTWANVPNSFRGTEIWTDGTDIYYSDSTSAQLVLNKQTGEWENMEWGGLQSSEYWKLQGSSSIWTDGTDVYCNYTIYDYVLDKATKTWVPTTWNIDDCVFNTARESSFHQYIWSHNGTTYLSIYRKNTINDEIVEYSWQYELSTRPKTISVPYRLRYPELIESADFGSYWLTELDPDAPASDITFDPNYRYVKLEFDLDFVLDPSNFNWYNGLTASTDFPNSDLSVSWGYYWYQKYVSMSVPTPVSSRLYAVEFIEHDSEGFNDCTTGVWISSTKDAHDGFTHSFSMTPQEPGSHDTAYACLNVNNKGYSTDPNTTMYNASENPNYDLKNQVSMQLNYDQGDTTRPQKTAIITCKLYYCFDENESGYEQLLAAYPNHASPFSPEPATKVPFRDDFPELVESIAGPDLWFIDDDIPFRVQFPELKESIPVADAWLIDDDIPFRIEYPALIESIGAPESWLHDKGWEPRRPWPKHRNIILEVQTIEDIPDVDWTKSMKQDFEFYTVDPNTWFDDKKLNNIISCNLTHDTTTDKRGNASITLTEAIPECYIRTYLVVTQNGRLYKFCLGTYLYMTSSDSFDGMKHNITMTGYTPLVELEEQYPKLGYHVVGYTNRKYGPEAPMVTDEIRDIILENTRCEVESRVMINKPLLNDFVPGQNDNWLTVVNNILNASSLQSYILTVDEWGTIIIADAPTIDDTATSFTYNDDNSSILLPTLDTFDDIYGIPNVMEVLYVGDKNLPAIRVVVKNEDEQSIVSIPRRGREIVRRYTINNIAAPLNDQTYAAVYAQVEAQAYKLLEAASTIQKTISYSHGYCDVKVGDMVLINYERAGMINVRAKVTSQRISCKPGCQVDETAVYTKKLWNRGV